MKIPALIAILAATALAQFKPLPPPGIPIPAEAKAAIEAKLEDLNQHIVKLGKHPLLPDVLVFREAVRIALTYNEFFKLEETQKALKLLDDGLTRARQLEIGQSPWTNATGLVVRGYVSEIDGSVQPYGLVIPAGWKASDAAPWRLDAWFRGRGEMATELNFVFDRTSKAGEFTPPDAIVLHLFGRYCNANKFAGEADLFEALASVKKQYRIDDNRIFVRGFSMGGAATWHIAAHHAGLWAGAAPGAGFAETREYSKYDQKPEKKPWFEEKLWRLYDATEYAANFYNLPLVAYSGEIDKQIQAAQIMSRYLAKEGLQMTHVIGPKTEHKYHPDSKPEIESRLAAIAKNGRDPYPESLRFTTYTLRYNRMRWITVDGLEKHWERASVKAQITPTGEIGLATSNISALTIDFGPGGWKHAPDRAAPVRIDGQTAGGAQPFTDRSLKMSFAKADGKWRVAETDDSLRKRHGLQGPIDDAFLSSFIMVLPSSKGYSDTSANWVGGESARAIREWRALFRGEARVKRDNEITDADIASSNLILWGDPASNTLLSRIAARLPLTWTATELKIGSETCNSQSCLPLMIYPNPLNPSRYVVLNSGPTLRMETNTSNSLQTPKLPDVALIDLTEPPGPIRPGKILWADFFDERWRLPATPAK